MHFDWHIELPGADSLFATARHLRSEELISPMRMIEYRELMRERDFTANFAHIKGQKSTLRTLETAVASADTTY